MPGGSSRARRSAPSDRRLLCARLPAPPVWLHRSALLPGLHPGPPAEAPFAWFSRALPSQGQTSFRSPLRSALHDPPLGVPLLRPLLTSRSAACIATLRHPFRCKARSPQVRTMAFPVQPPDLRRFALVVRASRSRARSPCSATPPIRFLFVGSRVRYPASFSAPLTVGALRLASVPTTRFREDFHLPTIAHAGHT